MNETTESNTLQVQQPQQSQQPQTEESQSAKPKEQPAEQPATKQEDKGQEGKQRLYTDAEVDTIIDRKLARWSAQKEQEVSEAQRLAEMSAQQRAEYERDKYKGEIEELRRRDAVHAMGRTARGMLTDAGVDVSDDLLSVLITENAETTKAAVDSFVKLFHEAVEKAVLEKIRTPAPKAGIGAAAMTKEQIMSIGDTLLRQQAIKDNMQLFA